MSIKLQKVDLIPPHSIVKEVTDEDYKIEQARLEPLLGILSQVANFGYYVVDYFKCNYLYVSDNISYWCGHTADEVKDLGFDLYSEFVPEEDLEILKQITKAGFDKFETLQEEERCKYTISYDFRFRINGRNKMVNKRMTPYALKNGKIWLALCILTISSNKKTGQEIILKQYKSRTYFEYSLNTLHWRKKNVPLLSDDEKDILRLIAQGMSCEEIAELFHIALDTIKLYRKKLKEKLGTSNFNDGLIRTINYGMFQI